MDSTLSHDHPGTKNLEIDSGEKKLEMIFWEVNIFENLEIVILQIINIFDFPDFSNIENVNSLHYKNFEIFENVHLSEKYV